MVSELNAEELLYEISKRNNEAARRLGYKPFNNIKVLPLSKEKEFDVIGVCPFCGTETHFASTEEIESLHEIKNKNNGKTCSVNCCKYCEEGRNDGLKDSTLARKVNLKSMKRVDQILKEKFGYKLVCTKQNMFASPDELITMKQLKSNGSGEPIKYEIPLKTILCFSDISFEDVDNEFKEPEEDNYFFITTEELYAKNKHTGETVGIESLLLNPERDSVFAEEGEEKKEESVTEEKSNNEETPVEDEVASEPTEDEVASEPTEDEVASEPTEDEVASEPDETVEDSCSEDKVDDEVTENIAENHVCESEPEESNEDESEITDDSIDDDATVVQVEPDETVEDSCSEDKVDDEVTENIAENHVCESEPEESNEDESEITDDSIDESDEFTSASSEEFSYEKSEENVESNVEETTENESSNSLSDEINIDVSFDFDKEETKENTNTFENPFKDIFKGSEDVKEEVKENVIEEKDNGEIEIDVGFDNNPFHSASDKEVVTETENTESDTKLSEAETEEENIEDESEISAESLEDTLDKESNSDEIVIDVDFDNKTSKEEKKNENVKEADNHTDSIKDESEKILEQDKKWYDNPVFTDDNYNENVNEFMDEVDLQKEFQESKLGQVIEEVARRTGVKGQFIIDENTYEIPVVDFESGVRIICIDVDNTAQLKVATMVMERNIPFSYPLTYGEKHRKLCLYSDSLNSKKRTKATIQNLIKIVGREKFNPNRIVNLAGNYALFYTDSIPVIRAFEEENSSYPQGKPCSKSIGIIALRPNKRDNEKFTSRDFMNFLDKNYKMDMKNHNLYMVATARYIAMPSPERKSVKYIITEYNELATTILKDGLNHIVGAIIKEHRLNNTIKDPRFIGTDFSKYNFEFEFEFDTSTLPSPSLEIWYDNNDLFRFPDSFEDGQGKCYIRSPEYRTNPQDGYRKDPRLFLPIPFSKMFEADIKKDGVNVLNDKIRRQYIERLGFVESYYPRMKRFVLNPIKTMNLEYTSSVFGMAKVDLNKYFSGKGIYDGGYDNILMQKFLNSSNMDQNTKNAMNVLMIQKMMSK